MNRFKTISDKQVLSEIYSQLTDQLYWPEVVLNKNPNNLLAKGRIARINQKLYEIVARVVEIETPKVA